MNPILGAIEKGWGWKLGVPNEVVAINVFGNALVRNSKGLFYRIVPEDLECEVIAATATELESFRNTAEFERDWEMTALVLIAKMANGQLCEGEVYTLAIPSVLGGAYARDNIKKVTLIEALSLSGDLARQIDDLPPEANVKLMVN